MVVVVFPGQGAQRPGMGDSRERFRSAHQVFERASAALGLDVADLCNDAERLGLTEYAQPAILTASIALLEGLREAFGFAPTHFGGHSLGEYTALVAAGVIPLESAVRLVQLRGHLMQAAVPVGVGGMAAIVGGGVDHAAIALVAKRVDVDVANFNSHDQIVLSGLLNDLALARAALEPTLEASGARWVPLDVSAPFHSRHMDRVVDDFRNALQSVSMDAGAATRVISNTRGDFHTGLRDDLVDALARQLREPVRWTDNMRALIATQPKQVVEIGPNRPLGRFFETAGQRVTSIVSAKQAERTFGRPRVEVEARS